MASAVIFRAMVQQDLAQVVTNEKAAYSHPWTYGVFLDCLEGNYHCWVLERDGELIGHGIISVAVGECHLLNVCVRPQNQGEGLGRELVEHLLYRAVNLGAERVYLEVRPSNPVARQLYESMGFIEIGTRKGYYPAAGGREDAIVLTRTLSNPVSG